MTWRWASLFLVSHPSCSRDNGILFITTLYMCCATLHSVQFGGRTWKPARQSQAVVAVRFFSSSSIVQWRLTCNRAACARKTAGPYIALNKNKKSTTNYSAHIIIAHFSLAPNLLSSLFLSIYIFLKLIVSHLNTVGISSIRRRVFPWRIIRRMFIEEHCHPPIFDFLSNFSCDLAILLHDLTGD